MTSLQESLKLVVDGSQLIPVKHIQEETNISNIQIHFTTVKFCSVSGDRVVSCTCQTLASVSQQVVGGGGDDV